MKSVIPSELKRKRCSKRCCISLFSTNPPLAMFLIRLTTCPSRPKNMYLALDFCWFLRELHNSTVPWACSSLSSSCLLSCTFSFYFLMNRYPCFWLLRGIVEEKEKGIRETLKTMVLPLLFLGYCRAWMTSRWSILGCSFTCWNSLSFRWVPHSLCCLFSSTRISSWLFSFTSYLVWHWSPFATWLQPSSASIWTFLYAISRAKSAGLFGIVIIILTYIPTILGMLLFLLLLTL